MNKEIVQELARQYNLSPSKSKGQNFLFSQEYLKKIADVSGVGQDDVVLEIGPGLGTLTNELLDKNVKLVVAELDTSAISFLRDRYEGRLEIIEGDVLDINLQELSQKLGKYHVVANIPYNITSKIIRMFAESEFGPVDFTLMIQKEVAQRVSAKPGEMSILAVATQFYGDVKYEFEVPRNVFWPIPAVDSAVITFKRNSKYQEKLQVSERDFFRVVKFGFAAKRKKLANTLAAGLHAKATEMKPYLDLINASENARAQELSIDDWIVLANAIYKK